MEICLFCATLIPRAGRVCRDCGRSHDTQRYQRLAAPATEYAELGVMYRLRYEEQLREHGRIVTLYSLTVPDWLVFVSLAALSGIIGNVATDIVKRVVARILAQRDDIGPMAPEALYGSRDRIPELEEEIHFLVAYIKEYHHGLHDVHPSVQAAIEEEKLIDGSLIGFQELLLRRYGSPADMGGQAESNQSEVAPQPSETEFDELWEEVEIDNERDDVPPAKGPLRKE